MPSDSAYSTFELGSGDSEGLLTVRQRRTSRKTIALVAAVCLAAALAAVIAVTTSSSGDSNNAKPHTGDNAQDPPAVLTALQASILDTTTKTLTLSATTVNNATLFGQLATATSTDPNGSIVLTSAGCTFIGLDSFPTLLCQGSGNLLGVSGTFSFLATVLSISTAELGFGLSATIGSGYSIAQGVQFAQMPADSWFTQVSVSAKGRGSVNASTTAFAIGTYSFVAGVVVKVEGALATGNSLAGLERLNRTFTQSTFDLLATFPLNNPQAATAEIDIDVELHFRNALNILGTQVDVTLTGVSATPAVDIQTLLTLQLTTNPAVSFVASTTWDSTTNTLTFAGQLLASWNPVKWISLATATLNFVVDTSNANTDNLGSTLTSFNFDGAASFPFQTTGQGASHLYLTGSNNFQDWTLVVSVDLATGDSTQLPTLLSTALGGASLGDNTLADFTLNTASVVLTITTNAGATRGLTFVADVKVASGSQQRQLLTPVLGDGSADFSLSVYGPIFDNLQVSSVTVDFLANLVQITPVVSYAKVDVGFSVGRTNGVHASLDLTLALKSNPQPVVFAVSADWTSSTNQFTFSGALASAWVAPFGLQWLTLSPISVALVVNTATPSLVSLSFDGKASITFASSAILNSYDIHLAGTNDFSDVVCELVVKVDSLSNAVNTIAGRASGTPAATDDLAFSSADITLVINTAAYTDSTTGRAYLPGLTLELDVITILKPSSLFTKMSTIKADADTVQFWFSMYLPVFGDMTKGLAFTLGTTTIPVKPNVNFDGFSLTIDIAVPSTVTITTGASVLFAKQSDWLTFDIGGTFSSDAEVTVQGSMAGEWANIAGLKGFDITNPWIEIGFGPSGITAFGVGGEITIGGVVIDINGFVDITNPVNVFFMTEVATLAFADVTRAFNNAQQDSTYPAIDVTTVPGSMNFQGVSFAIAPVTQDFVVNDIIIHFVEGVSLNASIGLIGIDHMAVSMVTDWDPLHPNFEFAIDLSFANLTTAFNMFMDALLPPHYLRPDSLVDDWEKFISDLSYIIPQLTALSIENLSMSNLAHGIFPTMSMTLQIYNQPHSVTFDLASLSQLVVSFGDMLKDGLIDLRKLLGIPDCIISTDCPSGQHCSHKKGSAWQCVSEVPSGSGNVPIFGPVTCVSSADCQGSPTGSCCQNGECVKNNVGTTFCGYCDFGGCNDPASGCIFGICTGCVTDLDCYWSGSAGHHCSSGMCVA